MRSTLTLAEAPLRTPLTLVGAPEELRGRLAALGLRVGSQLTVLQRTAGGGRMVAIGATRIALGRALLVQLHAHESAA